VLYEDDACLVILKPAGIPVHPGVGIPRDAPTILHGLVHLFKERKIPFSSSTVLVHRLDKDTTGCLLVAKTPAAHKALQQQFADRTVTKTYLGIVAGVPERKDAVIDASIGRSSSDRTKMTVFGSARTREAKTTYRTVDASDKSAVLACDLHTGRTHQIRVHLSAIGHPLLGDASYTSSLSEDLSHEYDIKTICLHAWQLTFHSPATDKKVTVHSPAPKAFARAAKDLGLQMPKN
jgi:23S rRNA pseudouridine1911/1915/1917 synthase